MGKPGIDNPRLPRCLRRLWMWYILPFSFCVVLVAALQLGSFVTLTSRLGPYVFPAILFVPQLFATFMVWRGQRRARVAFRKCEGRLCTACLYDLRGLGDRGTCPECQNAFDVAEDQRMWMKAQIWRDSLER